MNKSEAIEAMKQGEKVTHRFFEPKEFITMKGSRIETEEGYSCPADEFWSYRTGLSWNLDWEIWKAE